MADLHALVERLSQLTVLEAAELSRLLEKKWGVSAAAPVAIPLPTQTITTEPVEEQTEFAVSLVSFDAAKKIKVIQVVRAVLGLGLKESKELVEGAPKVLKDSTSNADALKIKAEIEEAGGVAEIK